MIGWRFSAPYLPLLSLTLAFGWVRATGLGGRRRERLATALLVIVPLAWFVQGEVRGRLGEYVAVKAAGYRNGHGAVADWLLDGRVEPGDSIALMDIGIISFECIEQRVIDITGLTDRTIARSPGGFLKKEYDPDYVLDQEPEAIVLAFVVAGDPATPPSPEAPVFPWSALEKRMASHPDFDRYYRAAGDSRSGRAGATPGDWRTGLADRLGAERVFLHDDPEVHYLLAVYRRRGS